MKIIKVEDVEIEFQKQNPGNEASGVSLLKSEKKTMTSFCL